MAPAGLDHGNPLHGGTEWLATWRNRPTHPHQESLTSHHQLDHHGQTGEAKQEPFKPPIRRIRATYSWADQRNTYYSKVPGIGSGAG